MNNIEKLREKLPQESYCALITSDINRRYFCKMKSSAGAVLVFPDAAYLLIDFRYFEKAKETVTDCEVVRSVKFYDQLSDLLKKQGTEKVYIEAETMTVSELSVYAEKLDGYKIDSTSFLSDAVTKLRSVKTADELEKMQKAQDIAEAALDNALQNVIKEGATELEVARALDFYMLSHGAEAISFDTIALSGKNTSVPHGVPSDKRIQKGEFVLMDFGAVFDGYHSDMTRTVCVGEPTAEMKEVYEITLEAQKRCLDFVHSGVVCKELDACARDYITEKGYGEAFGHGLGHSVGLEIHESPAANTRDTTVLTENVVMTIEPGIYLPEKFGVRIEDCVFVTKNGYTNFAHSPKNLMIL
ncbi:MAG: M24 family metallopeptidase [Oscillospiraceae bacterium]